MKKKFFLFLSLSVLSGLKAQDTIPFLDPCLSYPTITSFFPPYNVFPQDTLLNIEMCMEKNILSNITFRHNLPLGKKIYGIATTPTSDNLPPGVIIYICTYDQSDGFTLYDSISGGDHCFTKKMYYDYNGGNCPNQNTPPSVVPCNIHLFNNKINVPEIFLIKSNSYRESIGSIQFYCSSSSTITTFGLYENGNNPFWGGFFPILELPCPKPAKPHVGPNYAGDVTLRWTSGDTSLYQLAFHTYQDDTPVYTTDTLTDTLFHLVDSLAPTAMADGRYTVRIRKACNYMDSPYHTIVWSDWSEPQQFLYMHRREGLVGPGTEILPFSLTPNPTSGDATITFDTPLPADATLDVYGPDGRLLDSFTLPAGTASHRLATASYSSGLYLLRLATPSAAGTQKLSIQH